MALYFCHICFVSLPNFHMNRFCVIGSLNVDLVVAADRLPRPSETVIAKDFQINPAGGKGANQAVALARLGAEVSLVGKIGDKFHGPEYLERLKEAKVDCQLIDVEPGYPGVATIGVDENGENSILVYPGANQKLDTHYIDREWEKILAHDVFLLQLEIPIETVIYTVTRLREAGKTIILDPAPAQLLPDSLISAVDYLTPNLLELGSLTKLPVDDEDKIKKAATQLIERGAKRVITKAGPAGAYITETDSTRNRAAFHVEVLDTTAAGDAFNAGFAVALARNETINDAVRFANAAAALSITGAGAQSAMPTLDQTEALLATRFPKFQK